MFTDILERTPGLKVMRITLDYYRSFKYQSAKEISNYCDKNGPPDLIVIDAPRDEETKYLHEAYGVLEEINNGRLEGSFNGNMIKRRMPRNIPIIVFSNSPPLIKALSPDRWVIKALINYDDNDEHDVYIQKAKVSSNVKEVLGNSVYWQNYTETVIDQELVDEYESQRLLMEMQVKNIELTKKLIKVEEDMTGETSKKLPGQVIEYGPVETSTLGKAPQYVMLSARYLLRKINQNKKA